MVDPKSEVDSLLCLLSHYGPDAQLQYLDAEGPLDNGIWQVRWQGADLHRGRAELAALLSAGLTDLELHNRTIGFVGLPAGSSVHEFMRYLLTRIDVALAHPSYLPDDVGVVEPGAEGITHRSRFADTATANQATTEVLRAHEARFRGWAAQPGGTARLPLYAELDRPIGWITPLDAWGRPGGDPIEASACVTLMRLDAATGTPYVASSYPELSADPAIRAGEPDLELLFAGFFGQDVRAVDGCHWGGEYRFHETNPAQVVDRVRDRLAGLLELDEPTLQATIRALGSCTLTADARRWVGGLHRRMTHLQWTAPNG